ncbi:hypothetical protein CR513_47775, partial [Mucuna pruriens]
MKYPIGNLVGVIRAYQSITRRCYDESTQVLEDRRGRYTMPKEHTRIHLLELDPRLEPHQRTKIEASLDPRVEGELVRVLKENRDAFAWTPADMLGIDPDFLCHRLSISLGAHPVSQKKRRLGNEKKRVVKLNTPTGYVVMVKKTSGKWRMCIDYTNINRTCSEDPYPLPNIDALVDRASSCSLLSFMDAYSGYNQIRMHPSDKSKTAFITNKGNFCYRVMSFSLKNVWATYHRLMD